MAAESYGYGNCTSRHLADEFPVTGPIRNPKLPRLTAAFGVPELLRAEGPEESSYGAASGEYPAPGTRLPIQSNL